MLYLNLMTMLTLIYITTVTESVSKAVRWKSDESSEPGLMKKSSDDEVNSRLERNFLQLQVSHVEENAVKLL